MIAKKIILILSLLAGSILAYAQHSTPIHQSGNTPVLINDLHAESLKQANSKLTGIPLSATEVINNLTPEQIKSITRIEKCRNKKLKKIQACITKQKNNIEELTNADKKNDKKISKLADKISRLASNYQKTLQSASTKIISKLNNDQQKEYNSHFLK